MKRLLLVISIFLTHAASAADLQMATRKMAELLYGHKDIAQQALQAEGTINGGGGLGVSCQEPDGTTKISLLDMYESDHLWGLTPLSDDPQTEEEAFTLLANFLGEHFWNPWTFDKVEMKAGIKEELREFFQAAQFLTSGTDLQPTGDAHSPIIDPRCKPVQIALFYNESKLLIDSDLWNQLSWRDRAALIGHELLYLIGRMNGETDSINTRKFISYLLSTHGLKPMAYGAPSDPKKIINCNSGEEPGSSGMVRFFGYETLDSDGHQQIEFTFSTFNGRESIFRTNFYIPMSFDRFFDLSFHHFGLDADLSQDTFPHQNNSIYIHMTEVSPDTSSVLNGTMYYSNQNGVAIAGPWKVSCWKTL